MTLHADFLASPSIRTSLKRGLARRALSDAARDDADLPAFFVLTRALRPNRKAMERKVQRLRSLRGVVRAGIAAGGEGLVVLLRSQCDLVTRKDAADLFSEPSLVYTHVAIESSRHGTGFRIRRATFGLHALERLVERSRVALDRALLDAADSEARAIFRGWSRDTVIEDDGDHYLPAQEPGLWAGGFDCAALGSDWGLFHREGPQAVPVFSARTFLNPDQMRPTVWVKWRKDPGLSVG